MTIAAVWGTVEGAEVICRKAAGTNRWETTVPADLTDGTYICEFYAQDEAGNITYRTAVLLIRDGLVLSVSWKEEPYKIVLEPERIVSTLVPDIYSISLDAERCITA